MTFFKLKQALFYHIPSGFSYNLKTSPKIINNANTIENKKKDLFNGIKYLFLNGNKILKECNGKLIGCSCLDSMHMRIIHVLTQ